MSTPSEGMYHRCRPAKAGLGFHPRHHRKSMTTHRCSTTTPLADMWDPYTGAPTSQPRASKTAPHPSSLLLKPRSPPPPQPCLSRCRPPPRRANRPPPSVAPRAKPASITPPRLDRASRHRLRHYAPSRSDPPPNDAARRMHRRHALVSRPRPPCLR